VSRSGNIIVALLIAAAAFAQSSFEVASIKPSGPQSIRGWEGDPGTSDPVVYRYGRATLQDLIGVAFDVQLFQISSSIPLDRETFDLIARIAPGTAKPEFRMMMRNLLMDRFRFRFHVETREFTAWILTVAKTGPKLGNPAKGAVSFADGQAFPNLPPDRPGMIANHSISGAWELIRVRARKEPIAVLARMIRPEPGEPVVDQTGLTGTFDFTLAYSKEMPNAGNGFAPEPAEAPDLVTALQQQLGLRLARGKAPFDVVVVEAIDRKPSEN
jgi:uncharacterized protein (TIGR03435 family)